MAVETTYLVSYIVLIIVLFIVTHTTTLLTDRQTTELFVSSILFMFIMGVLMNKLIPNYTTHTIAVYGFCYTFWYALTKMVVNAISKDDNGNIVEN